MRTLRPFVALAIVLATQAAAAGPKRVLILHSFGRDVEAHATFARSFRSDLASRSAHAIEFHDLSLGTATAGGPRVESSFADYLAAFDDENRFDLVVALGGPASRFIQTHRPRFFSQTPLLIAGTDARHLREAALSPLDAVLPMGVDLNAIFENVLRVRPHTKEILVVLGRSTLEQYWVEQIRKESAPFLDRVRFTFLDGLPFDRILERAGAPPADAAIFFGMMAQDAAGVPHPEDRALGSLRAHARAPIFGVYVHQLGNGIVGGPLVDLDALAARSAEIADRILSGEPASRLRATPDPSVFLYDATELARWDVEASRLPPGAGIRFGRRSTWERYRGRILAVAALCIGQGALIVWLYVSRKRMRDAQREIRDVNRRLVASQEDERARLARELHDDVTQRLARLAIDAGQAEAKGADATTLRLLREGLVRLSENVHALSYSLHPSILDDLGLAEAIQAECERVSHQAGLAVDVVAVDLPGAIPVGTSRCLFRVAQEALRNVVRHAGARTIEVQLLGEPRGIQLIVRDDGAGFDPSGPKGRPTLGLASMRERVHTAGGTLRVESAPGGGTTVTAWAPIGERSE